MKTIAIIKYVFSAAGLLLLVVAVYSLVHTKIFLRDAVTSDGSVVDLIESTRTRKTDDGRRVRSTIYKPVVKFETQAGQSIRYTSSSGSSSSNYSVGDHVEMLYRESSPEDARINDFYSLWGLALSLGGMGSLFLAMGFSIVIYQAAKKKKIQYLRHNGIPIQTKFQSVERNSSVKVNSRRPYQILTQWVDPATSNLHVFSSDFIWFDPTDHITDESITVLIERNNPEKYHVDISFLPKLKA